MKLINLKLLFTLIIIGIFSGRALAQQTYTLQNCIDKALSQSLQVKADGYDLEKTKAGIQQAYSSLMPNISGSAAYQYNPQVQASVIPAETFGGPAGTYSAAKLGVPQSKSASVALNQIIYNASALIGLKVAKELINGNSLQSKSTKEDLVYNVSATYYNIQSLLIQEELSRKTLNTTEQLLASTNQNFKAGLVTETDVDRLTVAKDNLKASIESIKNSQEKFYNLLKTLMNVSLEEKMEIEKFEDNETIPVSAIEQRNFNPQLKTNYLQVAHIIKITELQRQNIKAAYMPSVSLSANYGLNGFYSEFNPFKDINDKLYPASSIGLRLSVPIFDGGSIRHQLKQKDFELKKLNIQAQQVTQQNSREVADAYADLKSNYITYENQQRNLALAQKVLTDINMQYSSGIVRITDVINTQNDLQTAQNNFVTALINIKQAELNLKKAQGKLSD